ncbi:hypothetical protein HY488_00945 [Candidatus Woesearchaeota archaeon]|nr:hypothetical protein [Candidatus Woesearchaeota archaeon]
MAELKRLTSLLIGVASLSTAVASRYTFHTEISDLIGQSDFRVLAEHALAGFSIPFLAYGTYGNDNEYFPDGRIAFTQEFALAYLLVHDGLWEVAQMHQRGFYQWGQAVTDISGCATALAFMQESYISKAIGKIRTVLHSTSADS